MLEELPREYARVYAGEIDEQVRIWFSGAATHVGPHLVAGLLSCLRFGHFFGRQLRGERRPDID